MQCDAIGLDQPIKIQTIVTLQKTSTRSSILFLLVILILLKKAADFVHLRCCNLMQPYAIACNCLRQMTTELQLNLLLPS
jgi:type III secretory pathway component EscU